MTSKWTTNPISGDTTVPGSLGDQFVVLLLFGKNSFGDKIYSYLKITLANLQNLKSAIQAGKGFTPSDFGEVVAAGKGDPPESVRAEVAAMYKILDNRQPAMADINAPVEKKAWDEY